MSNLRSRLNLFRLAIPFLAIFSVTRAATITFTELSSRSTDGVYVKGVLFGYTGAFSTFGDTSGPSKSMTYVAPPWLTGEAHGALILTFDTAITSLSFGYALNTEPHVGVANAITVMAWGSDSSLLSSVTQDAVPLLWSAEGLYSQDYASPVTRVRLSFNSSFAYYAWDPLFGLDNVTFSTVSPVPEASSYGLMASVSCLVGAMAVRRRRR